MNAANLSTPQSEAQPKPVTIAAAATIAPSTLFTTITGTTAVTTITPPIEGQHLLAIMPLSTNFGGFSAAGNIAVASLTNSTTWGTRISLFMYDPRTAKYYPIYGVTSTNS